MPSASRPPRRQSRSTWKPPAAWFRAHPARQADGHGCFAHCWCGLVPGGQAEKCTGRTHGIVDVGSHKIGVLEAVYVDTSSDEPAMATVQVGLPTRRATSPCSSRAISTQLLNASLARAFTQTASLIV
ncbi:hypothetical protein GCM10010274_58050 [Streptomyces lavendofoliae]|uniref:Uncharacterized protein n=1 Tax=Streptomyces lavendofoliae TaxID=67314 RepID=A0A918I2Z4_9ACTN|nr:hypothetical protein GCM10010274_58050 [Streptomyces lavendofoliae]